MRAIAMVALQWLCQECDNIDLLSAYREGQQPFDNGHIVQTLRSLPLPRFI
jgi:hypothetical protein